MASLRDLVKREVYVQLHQLPRQLPHPNCVNAFGIKPTRTSRQSEPFTRFGFAFITAGAGTLTANEQKWDVEAPCMMFHQPGNYYDMVPYPEWDELYFTYTASSRPYFEAAPWTDFDVPVIPLSDSRFVIDLAAQMLDLVPRIREFGSCDRMDQLAESLLLEALTQRHNQRPGPTPDSSALQAVDRIRARIDQHFLEPLELKSLLVEEGMSERHFRRLWKQQFGTSPFNYMQQRRMRQAEYLLQHSDLRINEIAAKLGYTDPYYFSRQFNRRVGCSPSDFRAKTADFAPDSTSVPTRSA